MDKRTGGKINRYGDSKKWLVSAVCLSFADLCFVAEIASEIMNQTKQGVISLTQRLEKECKVTQVNVTFRFMN